MPERPNAEVEQLLPKGVGEINDLVTFNGHERLSSQRGQCKIGGGGDFREQDTLRTVISV